MGICQSLDFNTTGRISVIPSPADRPTGTDRYPGQRIYELSTGRELMFDGTGWVIMSEPVQSYVPSFAGITLGNGVVVGEYHREDGYCEFAARLQFGSTTVMGVNATVTLPIAYATGYEVDAGFEILYYDASVNQRFFGHTFASTTTIAGLGVDVTSGTYNQLTSPSSTAPFTFATSDVILTHGHYRMTTRYS